jgi:hypothetical protein
MVMVVIQGPWIGAFCGYQVHNDWFCEQAKSIANDKLEASGVHTVSLLYHSETSHHTAASQVRYLNVISHLSLMEIRTVHARLNGVKGGQLLFATTTS